jgi:drug/metabolite transporter (DMT)-like permease
VTTRRGSLLATGALLLTTASWGSTFFLTKELLERVPTLDYLAVRFTIAGLVMFAVAHRAVLALPRQVLRRAVVIGGIYGVAQILQTTGLGHTSASVSGFITGMYVVCTPLLAAVLLRTPISRVTWGAVVLATAGLAVLSLQGLSVGYGEALTFVAAVLYAFHIVALGAWSTARDALGMSVVQLLVIAVVCLVATAPDGVVLPASGRDWAAVVYMAMVAGALALIAQTWAQSQLSPTRTAIIMSTEPVFAALFAVLLGGEGLTLRMLLGGALVLAAMLVVEVGPRRKVEGEVQHLTV